MLVRKATEPELNEVYLMGYDTWGADLPVRMYLESCAASYKYRLGEFYVLEDTMGQLVSSCIVYPLHAFGGAVGERAVGIGNLATQATERHKGYATLFLSMLMRELEKQGVDAFFIHSDIHPRIYENLGFTAAPEAVRLAAGAGPVVPMMRLSGGKQIAPELWHQIVLPEQF